MIIHEEPSPNSVSSPVSTAKDSRCYTVEDLMEMLLLSRPTVYRLLKQNEFRWFKVSGAYRISKASFEALKRVSSMIRAIKRFMSWPLHSKTFLSLSETHRNLL